MRERIPLLLRSGFLVAALGGVSRVLGLLRDVLLALILGVSLLSDVFFVALSLTQLLRGMALEGPLAQSLVAVFSRCHLRGLQAMRSLGAVLFTLFGGVSVPLVLLGLFVPVLPVLFFGAGFLTDPARRELAILILPQAWFYLLPALWIGLAAAMQHSYNRFAVSAATPILFNLVIIAILLLGRDMDGIPAYMLAVSIPLAGLLQLLLHGLRLGSLRLLFVPSLRCDNPDLRHFLQMAGPALLTVLTVQAHVPINNLLASFLEAGSISWLNYASRLSILPVGLIGVAAVTVLMPSLSRFAAAGEEEAFARTLAGGLRVIVLLGLPAALGIFLLAESIAFTLFQYGNMSPEDARRIAWSLQCLAPSIPASMLVSLLSGAFFARRNARIPLRIALILLPCSLVLKILLVAIAHYSFSTAWLGLALGVSLASWINAGLLWYALRRYEGILPAPIAGKIFSGDGLRIGIALCAMILALFYIGVMDRDWSIHDWQWRTVRLAILIAAGALSYLAVLAVIGWRYIVPRQPD